MRGGRHHVGMLVGVLVRFAGIVSLAALVSSCRKTELAPTSAEAGVAPVQPSPRAGLLPVDADYRNLLPAPRPGFTACSPDFGPGITIEEGQARLAGWRARPRAPLLHAHATAVHRSMTTLSFASAEERGLITLGASIKSVHLSRGDIRAQLRSEKEWSPVYDDLLSGLLPADALVASASEESWPHAESSVRVYLIRENIDETSRAILTGGAEAARAVACSQEESMFHRASYRVDDGPAGAARRIRLVASLYHGCTTGDAQVDMRVIPEFVGGTLVLACINPLDQDAACDAIASSVRRKR